MYFWDTIDPERGHSPTLPPQLCSSGGDLPEEPRVALSFPSRLARTVAALVLWLGGFSLVAQGSALKSRQVRIAAAADLKWALEESRIIFERDHPEITCTLTFGSSGNFFAQLSQRAPFDLFLSADVDYPRRLAEQGDGIKGSLFTYAMGHLVVWVPKASPIPLEQMGLKAVLHPSVNRVAIANPKTAPYGRAAEAALTSAGLMPGLRDKLVLGENIAQTAQFIQTGNADIGLISLSLASTAPMKNTGRFWLVPEGQHPSIEQGGVILTWAQDLEAARTFRTFLLGPKGTEVLKKYGFACPGRQ